MWEKAALPMTDSVIRPYLWLKVLSSFLSSKQNLVAHEAPHLTTPDALRKVI